MKNIMQKSRGLTVRYVLAAAIIAAVVTCGFGIMIAQLRNVNTNASVLDIGHDQHILSQRIAFLSSEIVAGNGNANALRLADEVRFSLMDLQRVNALYMAKSSTHIIKQEDWLRNRAEFQNLLNTYINAVQNFLKSTPMEFSEASHEKNPAYETVTRLADGPLKQVIERELAFFSSYNNVTFDEFELTFAILILVIFLVLAAEMQFIFRPMVQSVSHEMAQMNIRAADAEQADRLKSEFLATISHEIRSPMSGILGMAELLSQTSMTSAQRSYVSTIVNSGETLFRIIEDILDFSKLETDRLQMNPEPTDMLELVEDICTLYAPQAREKGLEIALHYSANAAQFVCADSARMRQVLGNLVNNAIKFTDSGHISLTVSEDQYHSSRSHTRLCFSVSDTGIGISDEFQKKVFEKFSQFDGSSSRSYGGMGLGLSVCRRIVEMMGGSIHVKSTLGIGSVFSLTIDFERSQEATQNYTQSIILKNLRVLIVDDLETIRASILERLSLSGMRADTASDGKTALRKMKEAKDSGDPYDMVFIDYSIPHMHGDALGRAIHSDQNLRQSCLIMMVSAGNIVSDRELSKNGFSSLISKPVKNRNLIQNLESIWINYNPADKKAVLRVDNIQEAQRTEKILLSPVADARILLAEDSRVNQVFAREILEQMGCIVAIAQNGMEAMEFLNREPFNLILMDCQMPVMDGFRATRNIRSTPDFAEIPIIALTANAMEGDHEKCVAAGMNDYISKPVRAYELREKVYNWLQKAGSFHLPEKTASPVIVEIPDLIDNTAVSEARQVLKEKYEETVEHFIQDVTAYISEMEEAATARDCHSMARLVHSVKSTSRLMGAARLAHVAMELEKFVRQADDGRTVDEAREKISLLVNTFDETCQKFRKIAA